MRSQESAGSALTYSILFFFYFLGLGAYLSSLSPFLVESYPERAYWLLLAGQVAYPAGYLLSGFISDHTKKLRAWLALGLLALPLAQFSLFQSDHNFYLCFVFSALTRFLLAANLQWISIALLEKSGAASYSRLRSAGTTGFGMIQLVFWLLGDYAIIESLQSGSGHAGILNELLHVLVGVMFPAGGELSFQFTGSLGALFFIPCWLLIGPIPRIRSSHAEYDFGQALHALANRKGVLFLILSFLYFFAFQLVDNYLGSFLNRMGGSRMVFLGWLLAIILEIPFLWFTANIARRHGARMLFWLACATGAIRFGGFALIMLGVPLPVLALQLVHGIQFMSYYMGAIYWLRENYADHIYGSVSGIYYLVGNAGGAVCGNLVLGYLLRNAPGVVPHGMRPDLYGYFVIFMIATVLYTLCLPGFYFLKNITDESDQTG